MMIDGWWIGMDLEGSECDVIVIASAPAEILTKHVPNASLGRYRYNHFGEFLSTE
jgi:hypothetical protein